MAAQPQAPQVENNDLDVALDKINNTGSKTMQWVIIALLVFILIIGGYMLFKGGDDNGDTSSDDEVSTTTDEDDNDTDTVNTTTEPSETVEETPEVSPTTEATSGGNTVPDGWQPIENETHGYTAYRPNSYYYRFFGYATLGIDKNAIPEVGEYPGEVTLNVQTGDLLTVKNDWISDWLAIAETSETKANGNWELVSGTIPESLPVPEQNVIAAFYEKDGKVYIVDHRAEPALFDTTIFDQFYPAILFAD